MMTTTKGGIRNWLQRGKKDGATHVIVVCDTFDHEDYPVYVDKSKNVHEVFKEYDGKNMQRVMEVYALHLDFDAQLNEHRAFHFDAPPASSATARAAEVMRERAAMAADEFAVRCGAPSAGAVIRRLPIEES